MPRVRHEQTKNQRRALPETHQAIPRDDGAVTTPESLAVIQALIPLGGAQRGSIFIAVQKLPITVPRGRDRAAQRDVPLATYLALQTPRAQDVGLFRRVFSGISCREPCD